VRDPEIKLILENQSAIMEALVVIKAVLGIDHDGSKELIQMIADTDRRLKNWTSPQGNR
jgi:hypothetical protein